MAKVFGPALSIDARGTLAKSITYQNRPKGKAVMERPVASKKSLESPTAAQQTQRALIKKLVEQWQSLGSDIKDSWDEIAKKINYSGTGYHYFIKMGGVYPFMYNWADSRVEWADNNVSWAGYFV